MMFFQKDQSNFYVTMMYTKDTLKLMICITVLSDQDDELQEKNLQLERKKEQLTDNFESVLHKVNHMINIFILMFLYTTKFHDDVSSDYQHFLDQRQFRKIDEQTQWIHVVLDRSQREIIKIDHSVLDALMTRASFLSVDQLHVKVNLVADIADVSFEVLKSAVKLMNEISIIFRHDRSIKILISCDMSRWCWIREYKSTDDTSTWFKIIDASKDQAKSIVIIIQTLTHLIFRKIRCVNAINTQSERIDQIFEEKVTQDFWHIAIDTQIVMTWNQRLTRSWAKLLQSDEQRTQWSAIQTRSSFTILLILLSDFLSSILQLVYIKAIFIILSYKLHLLSSFSLLSRRWHQLCRSNFSLLSRRWHRLCRCFARTTSSSLWSHTHIDIAILQHHFRWKRASTWACLSERISMNLKRRLSVTSDDSSSLSSIALTFLIYKAVRRYKRHVAEDKSTSLMMKNKVKQYKHEVE